MEIPDITPDIENIDSSNKLKASSYYIDNQKFSEAVHGYNVMCKRLKQEGLAIPSIPNYIGECFIKLSKGMARCNKFNSYTWKDDMIADGIENCLIYMSNYNIDSYTRTNKPNAFYYFSKIVYYAFVRRIKKEKRQLLIKQKYTTLNSDIDLFIASDPQGNADQNESAFMEIAIGDQTSFYSS